jgi:hypothetical protein
MALFSLFGFNSIHWQALCSSTCAKGAEIAGAQKDGQKGQKQARAAAGFRRDPAKLAGRGEKIAVSRVFIRVSLGWIKRAGNSRLRVA